MEILPAVINFGLATVIACVAVVGMIKYVKNKEKQTLDTIVSLQDDLHTQQQFIQSTLVDLVIKNTTVVDRCTTIIGNLTETIDRLNAAVKVKTCVAMGLMPLQEREEIEGIIRRVQDAG